MSFWLIFSFNFGEQLETEILQGHFFFNHCSLYHPRLCYILRLNYLVLFLEIEFFMEEEFPNNGVLLNISH